MYDAEPRQMMPPYKAGMLESATFPIIALHEIFAK
jgi:hypothetical protein